MPTFIFFYFFGYAVIFHIIATDSGLYGVIITNKMSL